MDFFKKSKVFKAKITAQDQKEPFTKDLLSNVNQLKEAFSYPANTALKVRDLYLPFYKKKVTILFIEGAADTNLVDMHIVRPLLEDPASPMKNDPLVCTLMNSVLTVASTKEITTIQDALQGLLNGFTVILIENETTAISVESIKFENRSVSGPTTETVIKGPKAAFNESAAVNRSLIRNIIRDPQLICESLTVGKRSPQLVSVMYLQHIADPTLVDNVKKRVTEIKSETILELSFLEQHVEERPYSLFPSTLTTERPDRAASFLLEGHIVLLMENSPAALIAPITFWSLFHTAEDQYLRTLYGNFLRFIRLMALFIALLAPALYIAITTFHSEMLPTDLMLAIAATRERMPFPAFFEILIMAGTFEILREAGVRVPTVLGTTIGIVGALILGQAAVDANIASPFLVIVIAVTGLASFTVPDVSFNITVRLINFTLLVAANFLGIYGISICLSFLMAYLMSMKSFGVPFFAPFSPHFPSSKDLLFRPPVWKQWLRPFSTSPGDKVRAKKPEEGASQ